MDICTIGSKEYAVIIEGISESFEKLYSSNTGRTLGEGAPMSLDCLGTFLMHTVTFRRKAGNESDYDELYQLAAMPSNVGIAVKIVHNQTALKYDAYISQGSRDLQRVDESTGKVYWDKMQLKFTPMRAQYTIGG